MVGCQRPAPRPPHPTPGPDNPRARPALIGSGVAGGRRDGPPRRSGRIKAVLSAPTPRFDRPNQCHIGVLVEACSFRRHKYSLRGDLRHCLTPCMDVGRELNLHMQLNPSSLVVVFINDLFYILFVYRPALNSVFSPRKL